MPLLLLWVYLPYLKTISEFFFSSVEWVMLFPLMICKSSGFTLFTKKKTTKLLEFSFSLYILGTFSLTFQNTHFALEKQHTGILLNQWYLKQQSSREYAWTDKLRPWHFQFISLIEESVTCIAVISVLTQWICFLWLKSCIYPIKTNC